MKKNLIKTIVYAVSAMAVMVTTVAASAVTSSACVFLFLHDSGDEVKIPDHMA